MKSISLFVLLAGLITGCDEINSPFNKMRKHGPIPVDTPETTNSIRYDSTLFLISISDSNVVVKSRSQSHNLKSVLLFDLDPALDLVSFNL